MSFDTRNHSALSKRAEQLRRWEESDTNQEPITPKNLANRKIKFSSGCVFLAACMSGDKEEVLRLLENGADIDTANVDGLTALHQACIDDNLEMVEFLVNAGADVNRQDNEGWTPLHATASCGFVSIARFLIENSANLAAVSSDGELALDLAESNHMEALLQKHIHEQRIDCEEARQSEERLMLNDAKNWLRSDASEADKPHPRTGATALHVAAAKGYCKVLSLLLATRADVDKQDNDGWTPLHAASHWGQKEAAQMLVAALADMDIKNYAGQTPLDVADPNIFRFLDELKRNNKRTKRRPASQIRISDNMDNHIETPTRVIRVEVKPDVDDDKQTKVPNDTVSQLSKDGVNSLAEDDMPWRRAGSLRTRLQQESPTKPPQVPEKDVTQTSESEVILRRTQSFENDDKKTVLPPIAGSPTVQQTSPTTMTTTTTTTTASTIVTPIRRSFVPPVRDEESETQRKAHAKRVRETRRSTQGVTLDEIKSAEELVKKINNNNNNNNNNNTSSNNISENSTTTNIGSVRTTAPTTTTTTASMPTATINNDRVPSLKTVADEDTTRNVQSTNTASSSVPPSASKITDQIVASYTISAPPTTANTNKSDGIDKITASYTIPTPMVSGQILAGKGGVTVTDRRDSMESPSISATISVLSSSTSNNNNNITINNKTDLETLTKTASPTVAHATLKLDKTTSPINSTLSSSSQPTSGNDGELEPLMDKQQEQQQQHPQQITPTVDFTFSKTRDKRSLFDIDNASSLSLADKLRNEANKYSEASRSNNDISTIGLLHNKNIDTSMMDSERKYGSTPSSPMHHQQQQQHVSGGGGGGGGVVVSSSNNVTAERRPSWRLKFDAGCKFKLEDAAHVTAANNSSLSNNNQTSSPPSYLPNAQKRTTTTSSNNSNQRPMSAPAGGVGSNIEMPNDHRIKDNNNSADITLSLRRPTKDNGEDKENDKENDSRSAQATQAVIQRRRRPKRRSTGVVHVDMDDIDPDRQDTDVCDDKESGSEKSSRSRLGSTSSLTSETSPDSKSSTENSTENGTEHIDYKALYEAARLENEKLRLQLKKKEEDLLNAKAAVDRFANATTKNSLSELEKRERRALERKLSEMEEELKNYDVLKTENQRLKDENGALIRVISKLSK